MLVHFCSRLFYFISRPVLVLFVFIHFIVAVQDVKMQSCVLFVRTICSLLRTLSPETKCSFYERRFSGANYLILKKVALH